MEKKQLSIEETEKGNWKDPIGIKHQGAEIS